MGIAWLLLRRTFRSRPMRTLLFVLGYALATAVMITLLSVGEAVLLQAQDKELLGGGDLILVPQGVDVESMKVGGLAALYYTIPQARFIVRQILGSSRFEDEISTVSPYIVSKLVYARTNQSGPEIAFADAALPDQEKALKEIRLPWKNQPEDDQWLVPGQQSFFNEIDRFHLPTVGPALLDRWAEWHYFNFESSGFYGYFSIMAAGNVLEDTARWIVSLQIDDGTYRRYTQNVPLRKADLPLEEIDYHAGANSIRFQQDHYEIVLDFTDKIHITGNLSYYPLPGLYFPPAVLAHTNDFESGYVIPSLRGHYRGSLHIGDREYDFNSISGYHDHNWGIWQKTEWNWGHAYGKEHSILFGEIFIDGKSKGVFMGVYDQQGFVSMFHPDRIVFSNYQMHDGLQIPMTLQMRQEKQFASIDITGNATSVITTATDENLNFVQYKMNYDVHLEIDGKPSQFSAAGNAETFVRGLSAR